MMCKYKQYCRQFIAKYFLEVYLSSVRSYISSLPNRSLPVRTVMNLSFEASTWVFLVIELNVFIYKFGNGSQKFTLHLLIRFSTNVSICSRPFSVLLSKLSDMSVERS